MIKRLGKAKKRKQGAILVIVVLILALAMIFIASAMMLTQATRHRLYSRTKSSQARLTVTSASEVFLEALKTQEISDVMIDNLLAKKSTRATSNDQKMKMVVPGVPGMSEADNNCTYVDIYKDPTNADLVLADFSTVIGDEQPENVRVVLKAGEEEPSLGGRFMNQIEVAAKVGIAELRFTSGVGMWNKTKFPTCPTDNTIVMRGGVKTQTSGSVVFSEIIFGEGASIALGGGDVYNNNVVFLDNTQMIGRSSMTIKGDVYFIGKSHNNAGMSVPSSGEYAGNIDLWGDGIKGTNFVFSGRTVQNDTNDGNGKIKDVVTKSTRKCYFLNSSGTCLQSGGTNVTSTNAQYKSGGTYTVSNAATSSIPNNITNNVKRYQKYDYNSSTNPFPSASAVFKTLNPDGKVETVTDPAGITLNYTTYSKDGTKTYAAGSVIPKGATYIVHPVTSSYPVYKRAGGVSTGDPEYTLNLSNLTSEAGADRLLELDPGYYYVTGNSATVTTTSNNSDLKPYVIAIDGANADKYRFYFAKDHTFYLNLCVFAIYNVQDPGLPVLFILEDGAKIQLSGANYRLNSGTNILCTAGFLSMSRATTASDLKTYIDTHSYAGESKVWSTDYKKNDNNTVIQYSSKYDSIHTPSIFIYGAKNNTLVFSDSTILEAYVGLYGGKGAFGVLDGTASVVPIYGRIEADEVHGYKNDNSWAVKDDTPVGDISMPYCPQPNQDSAKPSKRPAKSKYSVASMIYYYDSAATPT